MKLKEFNKKEWPYGFKMWLWNIGLISRKKGIFKKDLSPIECFEKLDPYSFFPHFMNGTRPSDVVELDINEGGE